MTQTIKTLLIGDDLDYTHWIRYQLGSRGDGDFGFALECCETLTEGLAALVEKHFDAVVLDLSVKDGLGTAALDQILRAAPKIPIVALTSYLEESAGMDAVARGAQDYLTKDRLDPRLLRRCIGYAYERACLEGRLERMRLEIQEGRRIGRAKDEVLSTVSHELRSPLTVIKAAVTNLRDGLAGPLNQTQGEMVSLAWKNGERLVHLVNNLLDLSRLESGRARIQKAPFDMGRLARETLEGLRLADPLGRIQYDLELPPALPLAFADPDAVLQVLTNLLNNAARFARGRVVVRGADFHFVIPVFIERAQEAAPH